MGLGWSKEMHNLGDSQNGNWANLESTYIIGKSFYIKIFIKNYDLHDKIVGLSYTIVIVDSWNLLLMRQFLVIRGRFFERWILDSAIHWVVFFKTFVKFSIDRYNIRKGLVFID